MAEVGSLFVRLRADASEFEETMQNIGGEIQGAGRNMQSAGKGMMKNVTAPLVGVAGAAVAVGVGFDDQMARVQAISGATGDDFEVLRGTAQELGSTTRFSASEAAEGLEYLALAGWDANEMAGGLGGVLSLASAAGMDLGRTSDIVTDTMSAFGIAAEDSGEVADMFATTQANANTNVAQLGEALSKAGPTVAAMGLGLDDTQAALGLMADQGLKGSRAGTALQAVMRDLSANAEDGTVSFGDFDVALYDAEGNMRDFGDILGDLEGGLEGMSQEQRNAALSSVFQQQALQGINPLLGEGSDRYEELRTSIQESEGASDRMSDTMEGTLGGSFRALKSQVEGVLIQLSDVLTPLIRDEIMPIVERFVGFIGNLIERFSSLDSRIQIVILAVAGIAAAIGPLLIVFGTMVVAVGALVPLIGTLGAGIALLASPITLVVVGIAALAAGLIYAYTQSETFRNIVNEVVSFVRDVAVAAFNRISERLREFADNVLPELIATWESLKGAIDTAVSFIWDNVIQPVFSAIKGFLEEHSETIKTVLQGAWEIIESSIATAVDIIEGIIIAALALIRGDWETAWEAVKGIADSVWDHLKTVFGLVKDFVVETFKTLTSDAWETVKGWASDVKESVSGLKDDVTGFIGDLKDDVIGFFSDLVSDTWESVSGWADDVIGAADEVKTEVLDFIGAIPGEVKDFFADAGSWLLQAGKDIIGGLVDGISNAIPDVDDVLGGVTDKIPDWKGPPQRDEKLLAPAGELIMQGLEAGIERGSDRVQHNLNRLTNDIARIRAEGMSVAAADSGGAAAREVHAHFDFGGDIRSVIIDTVTGEMRRR